MTSTVIADLAVLGCVRENPATLPFVIENARNLTPDLWSPTVDVIEAAVERGLTAGNLKLAGDQGRKEFLYITESGVEYIQHLLMFDPKSLDSPLVQAIELVQLSYLDLANADTIDCVLGRLQVRAHQRILRFKARSQQKSRMGRFARLWMMLEQRRGESMADVISLILRSESPIPALNKGFCEAAE